MFPENRNPASLAPAFRRRLDRWIVQAEAEFPQFEIRYGECRRSYARQVYLYASGRNRTGPILTKTLDSRHRWGLACDIVPIRKATGAYEPGVLPRILDRVPPAKYGLYSLGPVMGDWPHLEHAEADNLIASASFYGLRRS
jgi:peptidoglycan L-alanyl-D-glutamate endopeptidase CwlK